MKPPAPRYLTLAALTAIALFVYPQPALAQDSLPRLRAGRIAAEFRMGYELAGVGLLRFTSPTRAWVLDAAGSVSRTGVDTLTSYYSYLTARVGRRGYRCARAAICRVITVGATTRYTYSKTNPVGWDQGRWSLGPYVEAGGVWFVTPELTLGASWGASVTYDRQFNRGDPAANSFSLSFGEFSVRAGLYF